MDQKQLTAELESLESQRKNLLANIRQMQGGLAQLDGAIGFCKGLIDKAEPNKAYTTEQLPSFPDCRDLEMRTYPNGKRELAYIEPTVHSAELNGTFDGVVNDQADENNTGDNETKFIERNYSGGLQG